MASFIGSSNFLTGTLLGAPDAAGHARVRTERGLDLIGSVTDTDATPAAGSEVTVAIRPERMAVVPATDTAADSTPGWYEIRGIVHQGTYLGDQTEFHIETDQAGEVIVRRQNAAGTGGTLGAGPGDAVVVRWHEEANLILAG